MGKFAFMRSHVILRSPILLMAAFPVLTACGSNVPVPSPLSDAALAAVSENPGAPVRQVAHTVDDLFSDSALGETRAVVLLHGGEVAAERYAAGYGPDTRFVSWSMAKTVTAVLIGMLVADGLLDPDAPAPVPRWTRPGDPRGEITLRHLLQMRSGLRHTEAGDPPFASSEVRMLFLDGRDDMAEFATAQPLEAEPGERFEYSSNTSVILADIAARALTNSTDPDVRRKAVADYLRTRLFDPLGMTSMVPEFDRAGTLIGGSLIHGTARDWARFGDFLRTKGSYRGAQLLPRGWVEQMVTPSPCSPHYGFQTWLNRDVERAEGEEHPLFPDDAPASVFALVGHMGQYTLVSPAQKVTLVRLGHSDEAERAALLPRLAEVLALYPET